MATGLTATSIYMVIFSITKLYINVERTFSLRGVFLFYGLIGCAG